MSDPAPDTGRLQLAASLLASSVIGAPLVISTAVQTVLFSLNPRGVNASSPDAYGVEIAVAFALALLGAVIAVALVFSRLASRAGTRSVLRIPYMILGAQFVFAVVALALFVVAPGL